MIWMDRDGGYNLKGEGVERMIWRVDRGGGYDLEEGRWWMV